MHGHPLCAVAKALVDDAAGESVSISPCSLEELLVAYLSGDRQALSDGHVRVANEKEREGGEGGLPLEWSVRMRKLALGDYAFVIAVMVTLERPIKDAYTRKSRCLEMRLRLSTTDKYSREAKAHYYVWPKSQEDGTILEMLEDKDTDAAKANKLERTLLAGKGTVFSKDGWSSDCLIGVCATLQKHMPFC